MKDMTDNQANFIVRHNIRHNKSRTFNESGVRFSGNIWAFPNNRKIFVGLYDYPMDKRTYLLVRHAMLRHNTAQKIKDNRVVLACGLAALAGALIAIRVFKSEQKPPVKNQNSYNSTMVRKPRDFAGLAHFYTR